VGRAIKKRMRFAYSLTQKCMGYHISPASILLSIFLFLAIICVKG
jgi:hypothetical protein